jgi:solute carrier family 35 protein E1
LFVRESEGCESEIQGECFVWRLLTCTPTTLNTAADRILFRYQTALIPISCLKLLASVATFTTLLKVPVSYAHTIKALMPLCSVVLSRIILDEHHSWKMLLTLVPIVVGVVVSSATEMEFNLSGLIAALTSMFLLSIQTIFSKKVLHPTVCRSRLLI